MEPEKGQTSNGNPVAFSSDNLYASKAHKKREVFTNVGEQKGFQKTSDAFRERFSSMMTRLNKPDSFSTSKPTNPNSTLSASSSTPTPPTSPNQINPTAGKTTSSTTSAPTATPAPASTQSQTTPTVGAPAVKSKKPIPKKPFIIIGILLVLGAGIYFALPTIKYYLIPSYERWAEIFEKDKKKGIEYYYRLIRNETPEKKSDLLLYLADALYRDYNTDHSEEILQILRDAESYDPTAKVAFYMADFEQQYGNESEAEKWLGIMEERGGYDDSN